MTPLSPFADLAGKLLLAAPTLRDGPFRKAVILLAEYSTEEGGFGLVLNHPSGQKVGDLLPGDEAQNLAEIPVHLGGPVSRDHLTFAAFWKRGSGLGFAARISVEEAAAYVGKPDTLVRAFVGYSGWAKDQLEEEMESQSWFALKPEEVLLTARHDITLWKKLMCGISPFHRLLAEAPDEVMAN